MKKLASLIAMILVLFCTGVWAADGTVTESTSDYGRNQEVFVITWTCVGAASGVTGSIPDTDTTTATTNTLVNGQYYLWKVQTISGTTGPTADSDVYIRDTNSIDLLGGQGVDALDNTADNEVCPVIGSGYTLQPVVGALTLDVDNNSIASSDYVIKGYFWKREAN